MNTYGVGRMRNKQKDAIQMEEKRQRILNAGFELFSTHPIESVTMPEVAEKSGVGRATLYRYYSSKTELVIAIGSWKWADFYTIPSPNG